MVNIGKTDKKFRKDVTKITFDVMKDITKNRKTVVNKVSSKKLLKGMGIDLV